VPQLELLPSVPGSIDWFSQKFVRGATEVLPLQLLLSFVAGVARLRFVPQLESLPSVPGSIDWYSQNSFVVRLKCCHSSYGLLQQQRAIWVWTITQLYQSKFPARTTAAAIEGQKRMQR